MPLRRTGAISTKKIFFKYYKIDDNKTVAVMAGRCMRCRKVTDLFCSKCTKFVCESHLYKKKEKSQEKIICYLCKSKGCKVLSKKEIVAIRSAELKL